MMPEDLGKWYVRNNNGANGGIQCFWLLRSWQWNLWFAQVRSVSMVICLGEYFKVTGTSEYHQGEAMD